MPSMMIKPEHMEFVEMIAKRREMSKDDAMDTVVRAGIHRMKATINYAKNHKKDPKPRKPKAEKKAKAPKAEKKAKAPKAAKKTGGDSLLD